MLRIDDLRERVDGIDYAKLDGGFAEIANLVRDPFYIDYYTVGGRLNESVGNAFQKAGLSEYVRVHDASFNQQEVCAASERVMPLLSDDRISGTLDMRRGVISLTSRTRPDDSKLQAVRQAASPVPVEWKVGEVFDEHLGGGLPFGQCTAGFVVAEGDNTGNRGIGTAHHCPSESSYQGNPVQFQGGQENGSLDYRWYDGSNTTWSANFFAGSGNRTATGRVNRNNMTIGDIVCHYGQVTKYGCGEIVSKNALGAFSGAAYTFIEVEPLSTNIDLSEKGDSGGPWFYNFDAYGFMHAGIIGLPGDALFMAQNYTRDLDTVVFTS
jgi:hypothetical protein